ncbi:lipopolysaccharide transport periplasmic protein LptA [Alginatibacterium sediminis]|uniref:Lipopolysaccharide export system protein LptA n=1 Tax=Alginatibacterium sediminis TaxID=2164068 RepID=A0A420E8Y0_9ALTE|nr:lipopolysaccharide transport periplasmic protein LptA [Alginatibacterium sediminis]RKF15916.1 lipopolysaccharide transport periplasmic protein LptA [Alginatibacterium sediminis]
MKINSKWIWAGLLLPLSSAVFGLESDSSQPIEVDADRQKLEMQKNLVTFYDNVIAVQGSILIKSDKLVVQGSEPSGNETMVAYGNPATFYQMMDDGKPVNAKAQELHYDLATKVITLIDRAEIKQIDSTVNGDKIVYEIESQEMVATGNKNSRVKTVFLPSQVDGSNATNSNDQANGAQ